jgi:hypothetical protein
MTSLCLLGNNHTDCFWLTSVLHSHCTSCLKPFLLMRMHFLHLHPNYVWTLCETTGVTEYQRFLQSIQYSQLSSSQLNTKIPSKTRLMQQFLPTLPCLTSMMALKVMQLHMVRSWRMLKTMRKKTEFRLLRGARVSRWQNPLKLAPSQFQMQICPVVLNLNLLELS